MLFNLSLDRLYDMIENFNSLIKEYNDIIASNGGITIELVESSYRFEDVRSELLRLINTIKIELIIANGLYDKIKLTYPNFESDRLLEYNNFYDSNKSIKS
jgi:hypothetical protein